MADILLLGGTAWLGHEVVRQALAAGHRVTCLARGTGAVPDGAEFVAADRNQPDAYAGLTGRRFDVVVDVTRQPGQARQAAAALRTAVADGHWVFVSTGSVYLADRRRLVGDESDPVVRALTTDEAGVEEYGEGKVACENAVREALGDKHSTIARAGLIGGPGDTSDRLGYWPAAFARARSHGGPVLIPAVREQPVQVVDVRDIAAFLLRAGLERAGGVFDVTGQPARFGDWIDAAAAVAGFHGGVVEVGPDRLVELGVAYWAGPRSLPLWLPPDHELTVPRPAAAAVGAGLHRRPIAETLSDMLADETARGLDRERRAGLTRAQELELLAG